MGESIVQIRKLHFAQGARRIFNGVNFDAHAGENYCFYGVWWCWENYFA